MQQVKTDAAAMQGNFQNKTGDATVRNSKFLPQLALGYASLADAIVSGHLFGIPADSAGNWPWRWTGVIGRIGRGWARKLGPNAKHNYQYRDEYCGITSTTCLMNLCACTIQSYASAGRDKFYMLYLMRSN